MNHTKPHDWAVRVDVDEMSSCLAGSGRWAPKSSTMTKSFGSTKDRLTRVTAYLTAIWKHPRQKLADHGGSAWKLTSVIKGDVWRKLIKTWTSINTSRMPGQCQTPSLQCLKVSVVTQGWAKHWQECLATRTIRILRNQTNHRTPHILKGCWGASCIFPYLLIENCKQGSPTRIWAPALSAVIHPVVLQALDPKWSTSKDQPSGFEELGIASLMTRQDRQGHPVFFNLPPCFFNPPLVCLTHPCFFNPPQWSRSSIHPKRSKKLGTHCVLGPIAPRAYVKARPHLLPVLLMPTGGTINQQRQSHPQKLGVMIVMVHIGTVNLRKLVKFDRYAATFSGMAQAAASGNSCWVKSKRWVEMVEKVVAASSLCKRCLFKGTACHSSI